LFVYPLRHITISVIATLKICLLLRLLQMLKVLGLIILCVPCFISVCSLGWKFQHLVVNWTFIDNDKQTILLTSISKRTTLCQIVRFYLHLLWQSVNVWFFISTLKSLQNILCSMIFWVSCCAGRSFCVCSFCQVKYNI